MTNQAKGTFDVKVTPVAMDEHESPPLGRMSLDKQYHGDLEAASKGEMLTAGAIQKGSAGYVAVERVTGTLNGRRGSFALQHNATMTRGVGNLNIIVVPDSGTEELAGLSGAMTIEITGGKHLYQMEYRFEA